MTGEVSSARAPAADVPGRQSRLAASMLLALAGWLVLALLLSVPVVYHSRYIVYLGTLLALQAALAVSLNIVLGFAGQFALSQSAFFGFGAYASALLIRDLDVGFWTSLPLTALLTSVLAVAVGYPAMRFTGGIHLALITFAFGELLRLVTANLHELTGGPQGMQLVYTPGVVLGVDFGSTRGLYCLATGFLLLCLLISILVRRSDFGRALFAIRDDETLATSLGIDVTAHKVAAFTLASTLAALAGAIYAVFTSFISPEMMNASDSIALVGMLIVGGLGTTPGPILGTLIFVGLPEFLRVAKNYRLVLLGIIIVVMALYSPKGIAGAVNRLMTGTRRSGA
ncbi:branched-chain amino acid ABC transporter permease [Bradyrhizobium jicamae]|nr:branched-chain amino acid ABC transporter permease [Bradyrhizobium jicamae]